MKKYALLAIAFVITLMSCSIENDDTNDFYLEVLPIESVKVPENFVHGKTYEISITYTRPNSCYVFNDFIYDINGDERTIAVVNTVYQNANCIQTSSEIITVNFDFTAPGTDTYLFKFYQGEDKNGLDHYHLVEVPVVDEGDRINGNGPVKE